MLILHLDPFRNHRRTRRHHEKSSNSTSNVKKHGTSGTNLKFIIVIFKQVERILKNSQNHVCQLKLLKWCEYLVTETGLCAEHTYDIKSFKQMEGLVIVTIWSKSTSDFKMTVVTQNVSHAELAINTVYAQGD